ncbi:MAG: hypothetical protein R6W67_13015 [Bacteroidales bacterium]
MELSELKTIWKEYDKKLSENTRLNKEILRLILIKKPQRRLNWIKIKSGLLIFSPVLFVSLILILNVQFIISPRFFIGLGLFLPIFIINYVWDIRSFILIRGVDLTMPVLSIKKAITELEKYKIKTTKIRYLLMPLAMTGFLLMIINKITIRLDFFSILPLLLIVLVFFLSMYFTFKYSIYERYKKLNKDLNEIEQLERD